MPLRRSKPLPRSTIAESWQLLGRELYREEPSSTYTGTVETDGLPLHISRVTLLGVLQHTTTRETADMPCHYSENAAQALALRDCQAQLDREFSDAVIEAERRSTAHSADAATCAVTYFLRQHRQKAVNRGNLPGSCRNVKRHFKILCNIHSFF